MSKEIIGDVCAYVKGEAGGKNRYIRMGIAFRDGDRISLKLDSLPLGGCGWEGWVNIFPRELPKHTPREKPVSSGPYDFPDDIPF